MAVSLTNCQKLVAAASVLLVLVILHVTMVKTLSYQTRAVIMRGEFVLTVQTVLTFMSVMIWRTLSPFLQQYSGSSLSHSGLSVFKNSKKPHGQKSKHDSHIPNEKVGNFQGGWSFPQFLLILYLFLGQFSYLTNLFFISKEPHWFAMLAYTCLGSYIQLVTSLVIGNILLYVISCMLPNAMHKQRSLRKKVVVIISVFYTLFATMFGLYTASLPPVVRHVKIPVKDLPANLEGLTIIQISDIHLGPTVGFTKLNMIVDIVNEQKTDLVLLTGDLVDGRVSSLSRAAEPLSRVMSKYGNFFVSGNHEYYTGDVENWFYYLAGLGFKVLHNSNVKIPAKVNKDQGQLCLAGTDDVQADVIGYTGHGFDIAAATKGCANDQPVILLAHQPRAAKMALDSGHRIDVVLSGHTHGGQLFPFILGAYLMNPFYQGLYQYGLQGSHVYVCEGTQYWGIPMRIGTSTEITHITLTKALT